MKTVFKSIKWLLKPLLIVLAIIWSLFCLLYYGWENGWFDPQETDFVLIKKLEYFADEKLPSCKIMDKEAKERYHSIAIYKVDSIDFMKVFDNFQEIKPEFFIHSKNDLMIETKQMIAKSLHKIKRKRESTDILIYKDDSWNYVCKIGFIYPDIIVFEQVNKYPGN